MSKSSQTKSINATKHVAFANEIVQSLDALSAHRKLWEANDYKKANDGLYLLLADCLEVFQSKFVNADADSRKALRNELRAKLQADGIKVQSNSATLTMFVRFVFGSDRKRAHGYNYVLMAALSHEVKASELPSWIVKEGGIEEVKRKMVMSQEALANRAAREAAKTEVKIGIEQAEIKPIARITLQGIKGQYAVLLAKPEPDGMASVVGVLTEADDALVNVVLNRMAKVRVKDNTESAQLNKEASDLLAQSVVANGNSYKQAA